MAKATQPVKAEPSQQSLAEAIVEISKSFKTLADTGLNRKAIVTLVNADSKVSIRDINAVINSLASLREKYTNKV